MRHSRTPNRDGRFAAKMRDLYDYFDRRLWGGSLKERTPASDEVIKHLNRLRDAWSTMLAGRDRFAKLILQYRAAVALAAA